MIRALYSSATGMKAQELLLDVTANNLANVNTNGFKRSHVDFADLLYANLRAAGDDSSGSPSPIGLQIGNGSRAVGTTKLFTPGTMQQTSSMTDIAIEGEGFFKVTLPGGDTAYSRDGAFHPNVEGKLVNGDGYILDGDITMPQDVDAGGLDIGTTGTVTALVNGQIQTVGNIELFRFQNPAGLSSEGGNLFAISPASGPEISGTPGSNGFGILRQGFLEQSNVEVVTELVSLISAQRAYEVNARAIRAADEMLSNTTQIIR